jgi:arsenite methyltransferase
MFERIIAKNLRKPGGLFGLKVAKKMEEHNLPLYKRFLEITPLYADDHVVEIGFGPGHGIRLMADHAGCRVDGIDYSRQMVRAAGKTCRDLVKAGRVNLMHGDINTYPVEAGVYTKVFISNVIYFIDDLVHVFTRLSSMLGSGGKILLFMDDPGYLESNKVTSSELFHKYDYKEVERSLINGGFTGVKSIKENYLDIADVYYVTAQKRD